MKGIWHKAWMKAVSVALLLAWMFTISGFSSQTAETSSSLSMSVSSWVAEGYSNLFAPQLTDEQVQEIAERIETPIRKIAHFCEYGVMSMLVWFVLFCFECRRFRKSLAVLFCFVYAMTDELHQLFVDGRAGRFTDVCIDTAGAFAAMAVVFLISMCYDWCCRRKNDGAAADE